MQIETKNTPQATPTPTEVIDEERGIVRAIVSVTGIVDNVNDKIIPGAYTKTLQTRKPKGCWGHDWKTPVAKTLAIEELMPGDPRLPAGLKALNAGALVVDMQFNLATERGRDAFGDVKFWGEEGEWSIGYDAKKPGYSTTGADGIRQIKTLDLFEYSPVLFGAAPHTTTLALKDARGIDVVEIPDDALANAEVVLPGEIRNTALAVAAMLGTKGIDTDPDPSPNRNAAKLRRYWTKGPGAAKIGWGSGGDFKRCVSHLRKYVGAGAEGLCNVYHTSAMGAPPGKGHKDGEVEDLEVKAYEAMIAEDKDVFSGMASGPVAGPPTVKRQFTGKERETAAKKKQAMPHGGFPIKNRSDLANAIKAVGRAKDPEAAKAHIKRRAKALGAEFMIPDEWKAAVDGTEVKQAGLTKAEAVQRAIRGWRTRRGGAPATSGTSSRGSRGAAPGNAAEWRNSVGKTKPTKSPTNTSEWAASVGQTWTGGVRGQQERRDANNAALAASQARMGTPRPKGTAAKPKPKKDDIQARADAAAGLTDERRKVEAERGPAYQAAQARARRDLLDERENPKLVSDEDLARQFPGKDKPTLVRAQEAETARARNRDVTDRLMKAKGDDQAERRRTGQTAAIDPATGKPVPDPRDPASMPPRTESPGEALARQRGVIKERLDAQSDDGKRRRRLGGLSNAGITLASDDDLDYIIDPKQDYSPFLVRKAKEERDKRRKKDMSAGVEMKYGGSGTPETVGVSANKGKGIADAIDQKSLGFDAASALVDESRKDIYAVWYHQTLAAEFGKPSRVTGT